MNKLNNRYMLDEMKALTVAGNTWAAVDDNCVNVGLTTSKLFDGIEFDKVAGAVSTTLYSLIARSCVFDLRNWEPEDRIVWVANAKAQDAGEFVAAVVRLGNDVSNYIEWRFPVASMTADRFNLCTAALGNGYVTGTGISDWTNITWMAAGFLFTAETDALADMIVGQISLRSALFNQS